MNYKRFEEQSAEGEKHAPGEKGSVLKNLKEKQAVIEEKCCTVPVARLDFLGSNGKVVDCVEYDSEAEFLKALKDELRYGVPLVVVLYRNSDGMTISKSFLEDLDTLPKGLKEEEVPRVQSHGKPFER